VIAGGYALDLWLGRSTRPHADLEVAVLRRDHAAVDEWLSGWDRHVAVPGTAELEPWDGSIEAPRHAVWCRRSPTEPWAFELLFNDADGDEWRFRRDRRVRLPLRRAGLLTDEGRPHLAPEVVLLFKAKEDRERDRSDVMQVLPTLGDGEIAWLAAAIQTVHPGHPWLALLSSESSQDRR
jgi:hypothetical protein